MNGGAATVGRPDVKRFSAGRVGGFFAASASWSRRALPALALALSVPAVLALSAGVARAEAPKLVPDGQFESEGALGVAVDQSTSESDPSRGDVYVAGFLTDRVEKGSSGELVPGRVNKFMPSGSPLTPPSPIGAAQFGYSGVAVNPVNGHVYALDAQTSEIDVYDSATGEPLSSFLVPASENFTFFFKWTVVGIATDSAGNVYVPVVPGNKVLEYDPATCPAAPEPCVPLKTFTGGSGAGALKGPTGVSVDPGGNLWVADNGNGRIEELSPADIPLGEIKSEEVKSVAVAHGDVFATVLNRADFCGAVEPPCSHLVEYSSTGTQLADLGAGEFEAQFHTSKREGGVALPDMVAVSESTGRVYVTEGVVEPVEGVHGRVFKFTPPVPPKLEGETAVEVGLSSAKLGAVVNPGGISAAYRFEYGTTAAYGHSVPFPEGDTGGGFQPRTVWAALSGLAPGTTYHYRAVVTGELGTPVVGEDRTFTTESSAQSACPNEQFRTRLSAALPDCRAYELVTPPNDFSAQAVKDICGNGGASCSVERTLASTFAAPAGNRLAFSTMDVFPGSQSGGHDYLATRGTAGWSSEDEIPPQNYYTREQPCTPLQPTAYSEDLSKFLFAASSGGICGLEPELIGGEPRAGTRNLYLRDNTTGAYQLINLTPSGALPADAEFLAASVDFSHVVFTEEAMLTPDALAGAKNLYEWSAGRLQLVSLLPNGTPVVGAFTSISSDGSRVLFTADGDLYARVHGSETVQLDASQAAGPGADGAFIAASADGSRVLFTDDASAALTADTVPASGTNLYLYDFYAPADQRLTDLTPVKSVGAAAFAGLSKDGSRVIFTDDASAALTPDTVPSSGTNLYLYDSAAPAAKRLTDLTPAGHAEVQRVMAVGEDGSSVYFVAAGVLTGSQVNQRGEAAVSGHPNLYLSHGAATTFITTNGPGGEDRAKVSANGAFLAFESSLSPTGYDNVDQSTGKPDPEIYLYAAAANTLACASCDPSGAPPTAGGAGAQGGTGASGKAFEGRRARNLTENGRLFFDSNEGLLPSDTNGISGCSAAATGQPSCTDVYEFEPTGVGTCAEPAGCLSLLSTGTSPRGTFFIDASASGEHVFIRELQKLVPADTQEDAATVYDVRVDGGFPESAVPPLCTTADACRAATAPQPLFPSAGVGTAAVFGEDNLAPRLPAVKTAVKLKKCKKGYVKKQGKCIKAKKGKRARKARKTNRKGSR